MARQSTDDEKYAESVSWFDAVTTGAHFGRGLLTRANHATVADLPAKLRDEPLKFDAPQLLTVPDVFPSGLLNRLTGKLFSELWYRKSPTRMGAIQNITQFLHPLDIIGEWNRGYGPRGFLQYQFVVPPARSDVIREVLERMTAARQVSALNVLKRFGEGNRAPLSFPMPGWTLVRRHPHRPGPRRAVRRARRAGPRPRAGGTTWPRSRAPRPRPSAAATRGSTSGARSATPSIPTTCSPRTCPDVWSSLVIDAVGNPQSILLLGGTSEIGLATVEAFASDRPLRVVLAGRPSPRLDEAKARLEARGCAVEVIPFDAREGDVEVVAKAFASGDIDVALVAFGCSATTRRRGRTSPPPSSWRRSTTPRRSASGWRWASG